MWTPSASTESRRDRMGWCEASARGRRGNDGVVLQCHGCHGPLSSALARPGSGLRLSAQQKLESAEKVLREPREGHRRASM